MTTRKQKADDPVRLQAIKWDALRREAGAAIEDDAAFRAWIAADPAHERAYRAVGALWDGMAVLEQPPHRARAMAYVAEYKAQKAEQRRARPRVRFAVARPWPALAAAGLVVALAGWLAVASGLFTPEPLRHATALGEQRTVALADGSTVRLNTQTVIEVAYSDAARRVLLHDGQASFDVAADPDRPFTVVAGEGVVTAVGTAFDVYKSRDKVTVTLLEGVVEVRRRADPPLEMLPAPAEAPPASTEVETQPEPTPAVRPVQTPAVAEPAFPLMATLRAGEQVAVEQGGALSAIATVDVEQVTAWTSGRIKLQAAPLRDAIAEVNRYSRVKLVLADGRLADVRVSGSFKAGSSANFVRALEARYGIRPVRASDTRILLRSSAAS